MIGERIRELRNSLKLTQAQFGEQINLSQSQITAMEKGTRTVTERVLNDICREYNVNPHWLNTGEDEMFIDFTAGLNIDPEVKELSKLYVKLDAKEKKVVKELIKTFLDSDKE